MAKISRGFADTIKHLSICRPPLHPRAQRPRRREISSPTRQEQVHKQQLTDTLVAAPLTGVRGECSSDVGSPVCIAEANNFIMTMYRKIHVVYPEGRGRIIFDAISFISS